MSSAEGTANGAGSSSVSRKRKREETSPIPENVLEKLVGLLEIEDEDGRRFAIISHQMLEPERKKIYSRRFPEFELGPVIACTCRVEAEDADEAEEEAAASAASADEALVEHLAIVQKAVDAKQVGSGTRTEAVEGYVATPFMTECKISYEEVSPTQLVEYQFSERPETWLLGVATQSYLESFRKMKFKVWKQMILTTECTKTLRSLLALGPINRLFDRLAFPTPEEDQSLFELEDEDGKKIHIPHPVSGLRVWNAKTRAYQPVECRLEGAPEKEEEVAAFWEGIVSQIREAHGKDLIDKLMAEGKSHIEAAMKKAEQREQKTDEKGT